MRDKDFIRAIQNINQPIAFVLGSYITTGLGIVRSLGRQGIPVFWVDSNPNNPGFHSKYCQGIICPSPREKEGEYISFLTNIGRKLSQKGVFFTTSDNNTLRILKYKKKLEEFFIFPMSDMQTSSIFLNKKIFYKTLKQNNIPISETYFPRDMLDVEEISKKVNYPCLIKPAFTDNFRQDFQTKLFVAENDEQLFENYKKVASKRHEIVIQEEIPGDANNMYGLNAYYDKNYKIHGIFMYHRIREWPLHYGNGCLIENVDKPELVDAVYSLFNSIKYHGLIDAELKLDPRDNKFKFIEVNVRGWMQGGLPERCGVNIFYLAYLDAIGKDISKVKFSISRTKWLFMPLDLSSALRSFLKRDLSIKEWVISFKGKKAYAVFSWDDPKPFFYFICRS